MAARRGAWTADLRHESKGAPHSRHVVAAQRPTVEQHLPLHGVIQPLQPTMLNKRGGSVNKIHGSSNERHVLRTRIRVLFIYLKKNIIYKQTETHLVFRILGRSSLKTVDLPQPLPPTSAVLAPAGMLRLRPPRARRPSAKTHGAAGYANRTLRSSRRPSTRVGTRPVGVSERRQACVSTRILGQNHAGRGEKQYTVKRAPCAYPRP